MRSCFFKRLYPETPCSLAISRSSSRVLVSSSVIFNVSKSPTSSASSLLERYSLLIVDLLSACASKGLTRLGL